LSTSFFIQCAATIRAQPATVLAKAGALPPPPPAKIARNVIPYCLGIVPGLAVGVSGGGLLLGLGGISSSADTPLAEREALGLKPGLIVTFCGRIFFLAMRFVLVVK
jgi:hypothetical protein